MKRDENRNPDTISVMADLKAGLDKLENEYFRIKAEEELTL